MKRDLHSSERTSDLINGRGLNRGFVGLSCGFSNVKCEPVTEVIWQYMLLPIECHSPDSPLLCTAVHKWEPQELKWCFTMVRFVGLC